MADEQTQPVDLMQELSNLKKSLETSVTDTAKKEINNQFKRLEAEVEIKSQELEEVKEQLQEEKEIRVKNQRVIDKFAKAKDIEIKASESFEGVFTKSIQEHTDDFQKLLRKEVKSVSFEVGMDTKAIMTIGSATTGLVTNIDAGRGGILARPNRRMHIRDLVPKGTMTGSAFPFMYESAAPVGAPAPTAEGALKPEVEFRIAEALAPAEYIAGWTNLSTKLLDDVNGMAAFLNARLINALLEAEDTQLIAGTGVSPQLKGIGTAGNFTAATNLAAEDDLLQILGGIAQLAGQNREASAIILSTADYFRLVGTQTETNGLKVVQLTPSGMMTILGIPVTYAPPGTVPAGTYYVADLQSGTLLLFREAPRVEFFYEDSDNVRRNAVTVRIEERVAFPVFGSNYVIKGTF
jgi:HK97 family phage major capsid protein